MWEDQSCQSSKPADIVSLLECVYQWISGCFFHLAVIYFANKCPQNSNRAELAFLRKTFFPLMASLKAY